MKKQKIDQITPGSLQECHSSTLVLMGRNGDLPITLLSGREVDRKTRTSRSSRYAKLDPRNAAYDPAFPIPVRVGRNSVRWIEAEVDAYIAALPRTRVNEGEAK